jgi:hypothetical protein
VSLSLARAEDRFVEADARGALQVELDVVIHGEEGVKRRAQGLSN